MTTIDQMTATIKRRAYNHGWVLAMTPGPRTLADMYRIADTLDDLIAEA